MGNRSAGDHGVTRRGFTVTEALVVTTIIVILAAILIPVFGRSKRSAMTAASISNMRQLHAALTLYRQQWEGNGGPLFYSMGLPTSVWRMPDGKDFPYEVRKSPFPFDVTIFESGTTNVAGEYTFATNFYQPTTMIPGSGNWQMLNGYLEERGEGALALFDPYCNESGTKMQEPMTRKRVLGLGIDGHLLNHYTYNALGLNFRAYHTD